VRGFVPTAMRRDTRRNEPNRTQLQTAFSGKNQGNMAFFARRD
jgi:hypothetical protein